MGVSGMTGFARESGEAEWGSWAWEARSVNGRGLDVRINMPSGLDAVDQAVRKTASDTFTRGSLHIGLRIDLSGAESVSVNQNVLSTLMAAYEKAEGALATGPALATLFGIKGVVEAETISMRDLVDVDGAIEALIASGRAAIEALHANRLEEGSELQAVLLGQLEGMAKHAAEANSFADAQKSAIAEKYRARISEFDTDGAISEERLATEIAVLSAKADVTEELDRLTAHIARGQTLLSSDDAIGRDLGFLSQELNREANTLCSKSASLDLTNAGLALKSLIDQFKEQAANVE